jgi:hypothetical protein
MFPGAQNPIPLIKAKSGTVDIRDGNELKKKAWTNNPDVFRAKPSKKYRNAGKDQFTDFRFPTASGAN